MANEITAPITVITNEITALVTIADAIVVLAPITLGGLPGPAGIISGIDLPTSVDGLDAGDPYTQTATQLGGSGSVKVVCIA